MTIVPVLLAVLAARNRGARGLALLLFLTFGYAVFNMALLYYLRHRWL